MKLSADSLAPLFEKLTKLTKTQRVLLCVGVLVLMIGPMVYFVYLPKYQQIQELSAELEKLQTELEDAKRRARQLSKYQQEMKEVQAQYKVATRALPESEEIPKLLTSISGRGQESGLEFLLFKPDDEKPFGFYAEIPVSIEVMGRYHQMVDFLNKVAHLPRIVTIKNIGMQAQLPKKKGGGATEAYEMKISCSAVTYKFLENTSEGSAKAK